MVKLPRIDQVRELDNESPEIAISGPFLADRERRDSPVTPLPDAGPLQSAAPLTGPRPASLEPTEPDRIASASPQVITIGDGNPGEADAPNTTGSAPFIAEVKRERFDPDDDSATAVNELVAVVENSRGGSGGDSAVCDLSSPDRPASTSDALLHAHEALYPEGTQIFLFICFH